DDRASISEAIDERGRELLVAGEDLGPFTACQIGRDDQRASTARRHATRSWRTNRARIRMRRVDASGYQVQLASKQRRIWRMLLAFRPDDLAPGKVEKHRFRLGRIGGAQSIVPHLGDVVLVYE